MERLRNHVLASCNQPELRLLSTRGRGSRASRRGLKSLLRVIPNAHQICMEAGPFTQPESHFTSKAIWRRTQYPETLILGFLTHTKRRKCMKGEHAAIRPYLSSSPLFWFHRHLASLQLRFIPTPIFRFVAFLCSAEILNAERWNSSFLTQSFMKFFFQIQN
jgi:hypothetical protein